MLKTIFRYDLGVKLNCFEIEKKYIYMNFFKCDAVKYVFILNLKLPEMLQTNSFWNELIVLKSEKKK